MLRLCKSLVKRNPECHPYEDGMGGGVGGIFPVGIVVESDERGVGTDALDGDAAGDGAATDDCWLTAAPTPLATTLAAPSVTGDIWDGCGEAFAEEIGSSVCGDVCGTG